MTFDAFFQTAIATETNPSGNTPYAYQRRLACGEQTGLADAQWLTGTPCTSRLISIPTGLGKTAP